MGLTQEELVARLKKPRTRQWLAILEKLGPRSIVVLYAVAEALGVHPGTLLPAEGGVLMQKNIKRKRNPPRRGRPPKNKKI